MPATPARIGFILEEFRLVKSEDASTLATYGEAARRTELVPTFFENQSDAQAICNERRSLLAEDRRWFQQSVSETGVGLALNYTTAPPTVAVIDDERTASHNALVSEIGLDFVDNVTTIESWG